MSLNGLNKDKNLEKLESGKLDEAIRIQHRILFYLCCCQDLFSDYKKPFPDIEQTNKDIIEKIERIQESLNTISVNHIDFKTDFKRKYAGSSRFKNSALDAKIEDNTKTLATIFGRARKVKEIVEKNIDREINLAQVPDIKFGKEIPLSVISSKQEESELVVGDSIESIQNNIKFYGDLITTLEQSDFQKNNLKIGKTIEKVTESIIDLLGKNVKFKALSFRQSSYKKLDKELQKNSDELLELFGRIETLEEKVQGSQPEQGVQQEQHTYAVAIDDQNEINKKFQKNSINSSTSDKKKTKTKTRATTKKPSISSQKEPKKTTKKTTTSRKKDHKNTKKTSLQKKPKNPFINQTQESKSDKDMLKEQLTLLKKEGKRYELYKKKFNKMRNTLPSFGKTIAARTKIKKYQEFGKFINKLLEQVSKDGKTQLVEYDFGRLQKYYDQAIDDSVGDGKCSWIILDRKKGTIIVHIKDILEKIIDTNKEELRKLKSALKSSK